MATYGYTNKRCPKCGERLKGENDEVNIRAGFLIRQRTISDDYDMIFCEIKKCRFKNFYGTKEQIDKFLAN